MVGERIEIHSEVMLGKPVVRGTRIPVELVLRKLAEGASSGELIDAYPRLTLDHIHACLAYAADTIAYFEKFAVFKLVRPAHLNDGMDFMACQERTCTKWNVFIEQDAQRGGS
jgi:uncharacterized protein (DUF433 family)